MPLFHNKHRQQLCRGQFSCQIRRFCLKCLYGVQLDWDEGSIKVADLSEFFNVSSETIRKDLIYLEQKGIAKKEYGGAVARDAVYEPSFKEKSIKNLDEKTHIANKALDRIENGM